METQKTIIEVITSESEKSLKTKTVAISDKKLSGDKSENANNQNKSDSKAAENAIWKRRE